MIFVLIVIAVTGIIGFTFTLPKVAHVSKVKNRIDFDLFIANKNFLIPKTILLVLAFGLSITANEYKYINSFYVLIPFIWVLCFVSTYITFKWGVTKSKFQGKKETQLLRLLFINKFCLNTFTTVFIPLTLLYTMIFKG